MHCLYTSMLLLLHSAVAQHDEDAAKGEVESQFLIVIEITLLIMENHGKIMELCFEFLWEPC